MICTSPAYRQTVICFINHFVGLRGSRKGQLNSSKSNLYDHHTFFIPYIQERKREFIMHESQNKCL